MTTTYAVPEFVRENRLRRANTHRMQPCGEGVGAGLTCRAFPTALYTAGWFCADCASGRGWPLPDQRARQSEACADPSLLTCSPASAVSP